MDNVNVKFTSRKHLNSNDHIRAAILKCDTYEPPFLGDLGKKHFKQSYSEEEKIKIKKLLRSNFKSDEHIYRGKRPLKPNPSEFANYGGKKSFPEEKLRSSEEIKNFLGQSRHIVIRDNGEPAYAKQPSEYDMESYMNRKQRPLSLPQQRNLLPVIIGIFQ